MMSETPKPNTCTCMHCAQSAMKISSLENVAMCKPSLIYLKVKTAMAYVKYTCTLIVNSHKYMHAFSI